MKKLDLENVKIYTKDEAIEAIKLIGCTVYMSDDIDFNKKYYEYTLSAVQFTNPLFHPFVGVDSTGFEQLYKYFILKKDAKFVEEESKKYRPYKDISEFCNETGCEEVGSDTITIRNKNSKQESTLLYTGYSKYAVHLGGYVIAFDDLLDNYEYTMYSNEWLPFGVEE